MTMDRPAEPWAYVFVGALATLGIVFETLAAVYAESRPPAAETIITVMVAVVTLAWSAYWIGRLKGGA